VAELVIRSWVHSEGVGYKVHGHSSQAGSIPVLTTKTVIMKNKDFDLNKLYDEYKSSCIGYFNNTPLTFKQWLKKEKGMIIIKN